MGSMQSKRSSHAGVLNSSMGFVKDQKPSISGRNVAISSRKFTKEVKQDNMMNKRNEQMMQQIIDI